MGTITGFECKRCNKSDGYIWHDEYGALYFCGTYECLMQDSDSSKEQFRNKVVTVQDAADLFGMGARYRNAHLNAWMATDAQKEAVSKWIQNPSNMLILTGAPGLGKTYFCAALSNRLLEKGYSVHYMSAHRFMEQMTKTISDGVNTYDALNKIAKRPVLFLDDFGTAAASEWSRELFFDLIDQRYSSKLPTIITTNLSFNEIIQKFNDRMERRMNCPENLKITIGSDR